MTFHLRSRRTDVASHAVNVHLPKDRISMAHQGYGFCEFLTEEDAEYACKIMNQIKLWGKPIRVNKVHTTTLRTRITCAHNVFVLSNLSRRLLTRSSWTSVRTCLLAISTKASTNESCMTRSARLE